MTGRSEVGGFAEDFAKTPGPGTYNTVNKTIYARNPPSYSLQGRTNIPGGELFNSESKLNMRGNHLEQRMTRKQRGREGEWKCIGSLADYEISDDESGGGGGTAVFFLRCIPGINICIDSVLCPRSRCGEIFGTEVMEEVLN